MLKHVLGVKMQYAGTQSLSGFVVTICLEHSIYSVRSVGYMAIVPSIAFGIPQLTN